jgi:hypothetical protein
VARQANQWPGDIREQAMRRKNLFRGLASIAILVLTVAAHSQTVSPLFPSDAIPHSGCYAPRCFESTAALDNGTAIAATQPLVTVSIRSPTGWTTQQDILNPDIKPPRNYPEGERRNWPPFAHAIGLSGDALLIAGSSSRYNFKDVVYVFSRTNGAWAHTQTLSLRRPAEFEQTIVSHIAVDGSIALVTGTRYDDQDPAAAFIQIDFYVRLASGVWERRGSFKPPTSSSDEFGASMDLSGKLAVFGDPAAQGNGRAYLFEYTTRGWMMRRTFAPASSAVDTGFGSNVAVGGNSVAIAAPREPGSNWYQQGAVHLFTRDAGVWQASGLAFEPSVDASPDEGDVRTFGSSLSMDGARVVVGLDGGNWGDDRPHAYLLEDRQSWQVVGRLINRNAPFSGNVFVSGSTAIVEGNQEWGDRDGYVFELPIVGQL